MVSNSIVSYMKRLGSSVAYAAVDLTKDYTPHTRALFENNKEYVQSLYRDAAHSAQELRQIDKIKDNTVFRQLNTGWKNLKDSVKSGQFYSKEREEFGMLNSVGMDDDTLKQLEGLLGGDASQILAEMDGEDTGSTDASLIKGVPEITKGDIIVASTQTSAIRAGTNAIAKAIVNSAEISAKNERTISNLQLKSLQQQASAMISGFNNISNGLQALSEFNEQVIGTHVQNSRIFFEQMTNYTMENNAILKEMLDIKRQMYSATIEGYKSGDTAKERSIFDENGNFNLKKYLAFTEEKSKTSTLGALFSTVQMIPMMLGEFTSNPLHSLTKLALDSIIDNSLKAAIKSFDNSINGFIETSLAKLANYGKNHKSVLGNIARLFGYKEENPTLRSVDTSKYNKGPMQWNGIAQKALVEVIPGHLRRIESALTGQTERVFNFQSGKWTTMNAVNHIMKEINRDTIGQAFKPIEKELAARMKFDDPKQRRELYRAIKEFESGVADRGLIDFQHIKEKSDMYGKNPEIVALISAMLQSGMVDKSKIVNLTGELNAAKRAKRSILEGIDPTKQGLINELINRSYNEKFAKGTATGYADKYGFRSNTITTPLTDLKDDRGFTLYDYQYNILSTLQHGFNRSNGNIGGQNGGSNGSSSPSNSNDLQQYALPLDDTAIKELYRQLQNGETDQNGNANSENLQRRQEYGIFLRNVLDPIIKAGFLDRNSEEHGVFDDSQKLDSIDYEKLVSDPKYRDQVLMSIADIGSKAQIQRENNNANSNEGTFSDIIKSLRDLGVDVEKSKQEKGFLASMLNATTIADKFKVVSDSLSSLTSAPQTILTSVFTTADKFMYDFLFDHETNETDKDGNPVNGFFGKVTKEFESVTENINNKINDWMAEHFKDGAKGISKWLKKFAKDTLGIDVDKRIKQAKKYGERLKKSAFEAGSGFFKDIAGDVTGTFDDVKKLFGFEDKKPKRRRRKKKTDESTEPETRARGITKNTKYGLAVVGPGEAIIPADLNPWNPHREAANLRSQAINENKIKQDFMNKLQGSVNANALQTYAEGTTEIVPVEDENNKPKPKRKRKKKSKKNQWAFTDDLKEFLGHFTDIFSGIDEFTEAAFGTNAKKAASDSFDALDKHFPEITVGSLGGVLASTIFPLGGPLMGAITGSALSIASNNRSFQEYVFGKEIVDEKGNETRDNSGLISKNTIKTIQKYLPDAKKYGITGALAGLILPFGPLGGMMIGAGASILKNNKAVNDFLFGEKGGLITKDRKEKIKKALPSIGVATLGTLFLGPFGVMGNAVLGASLGLLSTTESFKRIMLGPKDKNGERHGGIAGVIRRNITDPFKKSMKEMSKNVAKWFKDDLFNPLARSMKNIGKTMLGATKDLLKAGFNKIFSSVSKTRFGKKIVNAVDRVTGALSHGIGGAIRGVGSFVGNKIGKVAHGIENKTNKYIVPMNYRHGWMGGTAAERIDALEAAGINTDEIMTDPKYKDLREMYSIDQAIMKMGEGENGEDRLKQAQTTIEAYQDLMNGTNKTIQKRINSSKDNIESTAVKNLDQFLSDNADTKDPNKLRRKYKDFVDEIEGITKKTDFAKISKHIALSDLPDPLKKQLQDMLQDTGTELLNYQNTQDLITNNKDGANEKLKHQLAKVMGIDPKDNETLDKILSNGKFASLLNDEWKDVKAKNEANNAIEEAAKKEEGEKVSEDTKAVTAKQDETIDQLKSMTDVLLDIRNAFLESYTPSQLVKNVKAGKTETAADKIRTQRSIEESDNRATSTAALIRSKQNTDGADRDKNIYDRILNPDSLGASIARSLIQIAGGGILGQPLLDAMEKKQEERNEEILNDNIKGYKKGQERIKNAREKFNKDIQQQNAKSRKENGIAEHPKDERHWVVRGASKIGHGIVKGTNVIRHGVANAAVDVADQGVQMAENVKDITRSHNPDDFYKPSEITTAFAGIPFYGNFAEGTTSTGGKGRIGKAFDFVKNVGSKLFGSGDKEKESSEENTKSEKPEAKKFTNDDFSSDELRASSNAISASVQADKTKAQGAAPDFNDKDNTQYTSDAEGNMIAMTIGSDGTPTKVKNKDNFEIEAKHKHELNLKERSCNALEAIAQSIGAQTKDAVGKAAGKLGKGLFGGLLDSLGNLIDMLFFGLPVGTYIISKLKKLPGKIFGFLKDGIPKLLKKIVPDSISGLLGKVTKKLGGLTSKLGSLAEKLSLRGILKQIVKHKKGAIGVAAGALLAVLGDEDRAEKHNEHQKQYGNDPDGDNDEESDVDDEGQQHGNDPDGDNDEESDVDDEGQQQSPSMLDRIGSFAKGGLMTAAGLYGANKLYNKIKGNTPEVEGDTKKPGTGEAKDNLKEEPKTSVEEAKEQSKEEKKPELKEEKLEEKDVNKNAANNTNTTSVEQATEQSRQAKIAEASNPASKAAKEAAEKTGTKAESKVGQGLMEKLMSKNKVLAVGAGLLGLNALTSNPDEEGSEEDQSMLGSAWDMAKTLGGNAIGSAIGRKIGGNKGALLGGAIGMSAGEGDMSVGNIVTNAAINYGFDKLGDFASKGKDALVSKFSTGAEAAKDITQDSKAEIGKRIKQGMDTAGTTMSTNMQMAISKIKSGLSSVIRAVGRWIPGKSASEAVQKFCQAILKKVTSPAGLRSAAKKLAQQAAAGAAGAASFGVGALVVEAGFAVSNFIHGMNNAEEMLKLPPGTATTGIKVAAGLVTAICGAIPVIGAFIPEDWVLEQCIEIVGPALGFGKSDLDKLRKAGNKEEEQAAKDAAAPTTEGDGVAQSIKAGATGAVASVVQSAQSFASTVADNASSMAQAVSNAAGKAASWVSQTASDVGNWVANKASNGMKWLSNTASSAYNGIKEVGSKAWDMAKNAGNWVKDKGSQAIDFVKNHLPSFGKGKQTPKPTASIPHYGMGPGTGFFSQLDPAFQMSMNAPGDTITQTTEDSGCGPISASNAISALGKDANPKEAIQFAVKNGYKEPDGGIYPQFYSDYLATKGIQTQNLFTPENEGSGKGKQEDRFEAIKQALKRGPVVFMGQDDRGETNKTPYAENPHYVTATGMDANGNIEIQDPESYIPNKIFKASDVINKTSIAIGTSNAGMGKHSRFGMGNHFHHFMNKFGRGDSDNELSPEHMWALANWCADKTNVDAKLIYGQWYHESGAFSSKLCRENYNFGGMTQAEPTGDPSDKQPDGRFWYMHFGNPEEWTEYFANYLNKYMTDPPVAGLSSVSEYAMALKQNDYYGADVSEYISGINNGIANIPNGAPNMSLIDTSRFGKRTIASPKNGNKNTGSNTNKSENKAQNYMLARKDTATLIKNTIKSTAKKLFGMGKHAPYTHYGKGTNHIPNIESKKLKVNKISASPSTKIRNAVHRFGTGRIRSFANHISHFGRYKYGRGTDVPETIWNFLTGKGVGSVATAAIMGNMEGESSYNPAIIEPNGRGHGLCQWTAERWNGENGLEAFAKSKGTDWTDLNTQLEFLWKEIGPGGYYYNSLTKLNGMTDVAQATKQWLMDFEMGGASENQIKWDLVHLDRRQASAKEAFEKQGKGITTSGNLPNSGPQSGRQGIFGALDELSSKLSSITTLFGSPNSNNSSSNNSNNTQNPNGGKDNKVGQSDTLDMDVMESNHPGDNYTTNLTDLKPDVKAALNIFGKDYKQRHDKKLMITGGAETWTHSPGKWSHHTGWKTDIDTDVNEQDKSQMHNMGASVSLEGDHYDIDWSGHDSRDKNTGVNGVGAQGKHKRRAKFGMGKHSPKSLFGIGKHSRKKFGQGLRAKPFKSIFGKGDLEIDNDALQSDPEQPFEPPSWKQAEESDNTSYSNADDVSNTEQAKEEAPKKLEEAKKKVAAAKANNSGGPGLFDRLFAKTGISSYLDKAKSALAPVKSAFTSGLKGVASKMFGKFSGIIGDAASFLIPSLGNNSNDNKNGDNKNGKNFNGQSVAVPASGSAAEAMTKALSCEITSPYGPRGSGFHHGIDFGVDQGTQLPTLVDGIVDDVGVEASGYGNYIVVKDNNGYYHIFGHLTNAIASKGDTVKAGQIIAISGHSGHCIPDGPDGSHLHYGIYDPQHSSCGKDGDVDPAQYSISGLGQAGKGKHSLYGMGKKGWIGGNRQIKAKKSAGSDEGMPVQKKTYNKVGQASSNKVGRGNKSMFGRGKESSYRSTLQEDLANTRKMSPVRFPENIQGKGTNFGITTNMINNSKYGRGIFDSIKHYINIGKDAYKQYKNLKSIFKKDKKKEIPKEKQHIEYDDVQQVTPEGAERLDLQDSNKLIAPNGRVYSQNDINYILKNPDKFNGAKTVDDAIAILSKDNKYTSSNYTPTSVQNAKETNKYIAPNGTKYTKNDIDYILKNPDKFNGAKTVDDAIAILSKDDRYAKETAEQRKEREYQTTLREMHFNPDGSITYGKYANPKAHQAATAIQTSVQNAKETNKYIAPNGTKYTKNDIDYILKNPDKFNGAKTVDDAIAILSKDDRYAKETAEQRKEREYQTTLREMHFNPDGSITYGKYANPKAHQAATAIQTSVQKAQAKAKDTATNINAVQQVLPNEDKKKKQEEIKDFEERLSRVNTIKTYEDAKALLKGIPDEEILEFNKLNKDEDDLTVLKLKTKKNIELYINKLKSNSSVNSSSNAKAVTPNQNSVSKAQLEQKFKIGKEGSNGIGPNGKPYTNNDILYILKNPDKFGGAKTVEDAVAILSKDIKYTKKDETKASNSTNTGTITNNKQQENAKQTNNVSTSTGNTNQTVQNQPDKVDQLIAAQMKTNELLAALVNIATTIASNSAQPIVAQTNNESANNSKDNNYASKQDLAKVALATKLNSFFASNSGVDTNFINPDLGHSINVIKNMQTIASM